MNHPHLRVSDADRDRVVEILNTAFGAGRITDAEHTERVDAALAAKTFADLEPLTADLVPSSRPNPPPRPPEPSLDRPAPFRYGAVELDVDTITATLSKQERSGTWSVPRRLRVNAFLGTVVLDLTQARMTDRILDIECSMIMSTLKLRLPRGSNVRDGTARILAEDATKQLGPFDENAPLVLLSGTTALSEIKVRGPRGQQWRDYFGV